MSTHTKSYQERAVYYDSLIHHHSNMNQHLNVYRYVHDIYSEFCDHGMHFFDCESDLIRHYKSILFSIRGLEGFGRSWGHAHEVIELLDQWYNFIREVGVDNDIVHIEETAVTPLMTEAFEALITAILEVLPAYVWWVPQAKISENQPIINFLQVRGNEYRAMGNPKFYAYDKVVTTIATIDFRVNVANCIYIRGVGPRISFHIREFLNLPVTERNIAGQNAEQVDEVIATPTHINENHIKVDEEITQNAENTSGQTDGMDESVDKVAPKAVTTEETIFNAQELPNVRVRGNVPLATYLWEKAHEFLQQHYTGVAWAWLRACRTVCNSDYSIHDYIEKIEELESFPFIGEIMADVIREFYQYEYDDGVSQTCNSLSIQPKSLIANDLAREYHQRLLDFLWEHNYRETAHEVARMDRIPQIRTDFRALKTCSEQILETIFEPNGNVPVADNWINQELTEWLWTAGNSCPSIQEVNYYNASCAVARRKNIVEYNDLLHIKYIGPHLAKRVGAEFFSR